MGRDSFSSGLDLSGLEQVRLHRQASEVRDSVFGKTVFVRAVVEISNFCRENCGYCAMRRDNRGLNRYRLSAGEIFDELMGSLPSASRTSISRRGGSSCGAGDCDSPP